MQKHARIGRPEQKQTNCKNTPSKKASKQASKVKEASMEKAEKEASLLK